MRYFVILLAFIVVPAFGQVRPDAKRVELDGLIDQLRNAPSEQASAALEARIQQAWSLQGGPAAALLLNRGARNAQSNAEADALDDIDAALTLSPDYAEAFVRRARVRAGLGAYRNALGDIEEALRREPRHIGAFKTLSRIAEDHGDIEGALRAWQRALEIAPRTPYGADRLIELQKKLDGEGA